LLMLEPSNPRSLMFQLERLEEHVQALPDQLASGRLSAVGRPLLEAVTALRLAEARSLCQLDEDSGVRAALDQLLSRQGYLLGQAADALVAQYFAFAHSQQPLQP
ncbi:MAG TPA: alpha-E domain-containing protein, partial [Thioalkalivibrio sp.]|nr:alpha-E domain-containing protein [Thioalkalivibrio sp.]